MSKTIISVERVNEVMPHRNADRLDAIKVLGYTLVVAKGSYEVGDKVVYFPPDILIPEEVADLFGVTNYLKHAVYPGDTDKSRCRVSSCRIRGLSSHGFVAKYPAMDNEPFGADVTKFFEGFKYEPPVRPNSGDAERDAPNFYKYTSIENMQRSPSLIPEGTEVVLTEKIHGTNVRMGLVMENGEQTFMVGSHNVRRKPGWNLYWNAFTPNVKRLLLELAGGYTDVIIYGEIFGPGVQGRGMVYGMSDKTFAAFDIMAGGEYLDWDDVVETCKKFDVPVVPELARVPYSLSAVEEFTDGPTTFGGAHCREGVVVKPVREQHTMRGRMILKSVSADYRNLHSADEVGE